MDYSRMRSLFLQATIGAAVFAGIFSFVAVGRTLWDHGHQAMALVYGAQCAGGFWLYMRMGLQVDQLKRIIERAERETGREWKW